MCSRGNSNFVSCLTQLFQVVEGWLPPADDESPVPSAQDTSESPPAKGNEDDEDESEEEIAPLVRKTRGQRQREIEASRSLERHDDDDELPETTSRRQATPSKKNKKKEKEARAPLRRKAKPPKTASPPHSTSSSDAHSSAGDGTDPATTALDAPSVEVPLASMPPPFAPVSGLRKAPAVATSPRKEVPSVAVSPRKEAPAAAAPIREEASAEGVPEAPTATSTSKKPSVSWAPDVLELGLSRRLGPELERPAGLRTGLRFIPVAK